MASSVPESVYRQHLLRSKDAGNYFTFFRLYYKIMKRVDALFIQDLINLASMSRINKKEVDGLEYFQCTSSFLENSESEWNRHEQEYHFTNLEKAGYIKIKRMGMPSCRWVYIDIRKLEEDLDEALSQLPEKPGNKPTGKTGNKPTGKTVVKKEVIPNGITSPTNQKNNCCSQARNGDTPKLNGVLYRKEQPSPAEQQATSLAKIIRKHNKLLGGPPKIKDWTAEFKKLSLDRSVEQIDSALEWYAKHFGEDYVPQAYCAKTFRQKFACIESAMDRSTWKYRVDKYGKRIRVPKGEEGEWYTEDEFVP